MHKFLKIFIIFLLFFNFQYAFAEQTFEKNFAEMDALFKEKSYKKAIKLAAKTKKLDLNEEQKKLLQTFMTAAIESKQLDESARAFKPEYNKYEEYYCYSLYSNFLITMQPYIYVYKNKVIYKIKFDLTYTSKKKMYPDKVVLYSDGKNYTFIPFASDDVLLSYNTNQRRATAWVNLTDAEVLYVREAMKANDVSFMIKDTKSSLSADVALLPFNKTRIVDGYWLYALLKDKKIEPGTNRF